MNSFCSDSFRKFHAICVGGLILSALASVFAQSAATSYVYSHLAGPLGGPGRADGTGPTARFNAPSGVAVDFAGNIYVADSYNKTIRKVTPNGVVTTVAGQAGVVGSADGTGAAARFFNPHGIALDSVGNIFVADSNNATIRKITPGGVVTTLAGMAGLQGSTDGTGAAALFWFPRAVAVDTAGNVYVADNSTIRKITAGGVVTTLAGMPGPWGSADGTGPAAQFAFPNGITVDNAGAVYVADTGNNKIRKITPDGVVTSLPGGPSPLYNPQGVAVDPAGNLYVTTGGSTISKITPGGIVTNLVGTTQWPYVGNVDGNLTDARFNDPAGLALDNTGNLYVGDSGNNTIRKITPGGIVSTVAGLGGAAGSIDGTGAAARFNAPTSVAVDGASNVYVADQFNHIIRKITPAGIVTTLAGLVGSNYTGLVDGTGADARFSYPRGVAVDSGGNVYVADTGNNAIRKITPGAVVTTFAGLGQWPNDGNADGVGSAARFLIPASVAVDGSDNVYVADTGNNSIRKITPGGLVTTLAGRAGTTGIADGVGAAAQFRSPYGVAADKAGNVYVADTYNYTIRKITPGGVVTTLAGLPGVAGGVDGTGTAARFSLPTGVAVDGSGAVYVTDGSEYLRGGVLVPSIRKITAGGEVTSIGGMADTFGSEDGIGPLAGFSSPSGIAVDAAGNLYIADKGNNAIRKGQPASIPVITTQPQGQTVASGGSVQLSVSASSILPLTYQWYINGSPFSAASTSTLSFTNARSSDAGDYTVVVTNALGAVTSNKATLTISSAPVSPQPSTGSGAGGGSSEGWFVLALLALGGVSRWVAAQGNIFKQPLSLK